MLTGMVIHVTDDQDQLAGAVVLLQDDGARQLIVIISNMHDHPY